MPVNGTGKYFANPAIGRAHEQQAKAEGKAPAAKAPAIAAPAAHAAHTVTIHKASAGKFHVTAHHEGGQQTSEHNDVESATQHAKSALGEGLDQMESGNENDQPSFMGGAKC